MLFPRHVAKARGNEDRSTARHVSGFTVLLAFIAFAQGSAVAQDEAAMPSPAEADTTRAICLVDNPSGIADSDARTAALLVCQALRTRGIDVGEPVFEAPDTASVYRVGVHFLGEAVLLRVSHEVPVGTVFRERQVRLVSIEEAFEASGRLVAALEGEESVEATATIETLIMDDLHADISLWAFGLVAAFAPGVNATTAPGVLFGWHYETPRFGIFTDLYFAGNERDNSRFQYGTIAVGGRYFLQGRAISPWIGGGAAMLFGTRSNSLGQDGTGIGVFSAVGVEVLRFNRNRLALELRLNLPFSKLLNEEDDDFFYDYEDRQSAVSHRYVAPVSLSVAYLRDAPWLSWW